MPASEHKAAQAHVHSPFLNDDASARGHAQSHRYRKMVDEKLKKAAIKEGEWPGFALSYALPLCSAPWHVALPRDDDAAV